MARTLFALTVLLSWSCCHALYPNASHWMGDLQHILYSKHLSDIVLPGTHDSGAYRLDDDIAPGPRANAVLQFMYNNLCKIIRKRHSPYNALSVLALEATCAITTNTVKQWAIAQSANVYQQLTGGIRFLDLRAVHDLENNVWRTYHMLMGDSIEKIVTDIARFMTQFKTEVIVIQVSHYAGVEIKTQLDDLAGIFIRHLQDMLFERRSSFRHFTIGDMVAANKRIILTGARHRILSDNPYFWPQKKVFEGEFANTDELDKMETHNHKQLMQYGGGDKLFQMFFTLTFQGAKDLEEGLLNPDSSPHSLSTLAAVANADFDRWIKLEKKTLRMPNVLLVDFFEHTSLIDTVKSLNMEYNECDDPVQLRASNGCRADISNCHSAHFQSTCPLTCGICAVKQRNETLFR